MRYAMRLVSMARETGPTRNDVLQARLPFLKRLGQAVGDVLKSSPVFAECPARLATFFESRRSIHLNDRGAGLEVGDRRDERL